MAETTGATRVAVEFLTLWLEPGDAARRAAAEHISEVLNQAGNPPTEAVIAGQLNLSMLLLLTLARERGHEAATLLDAGRTILRELAVRLPD